MAVCRNSRLKIGEKQAILIWTVKYDEPKRHSRSLRQRLPVGVVCPSPRLLGATVPIWLLAFDAVFAVVAALVPLRMCVLPV
jgi:hypothetical protein